MKSEEPIKWWRLHRRWQRLWTLQTMRRQQEFDNPENGQSCKLTLTGVTDVIPNCEEEEQNCTEL